MNLKQLAGEKAVEFVADGMDIGLGTGSTVYWTIRKLGEMVREGFRVRGVATSRSTEGVAAEFGVPLISLADIDELALTIDGADEIDPQLNLIKGGGGALLREKMVAEASRRLIIVADESKLVPRLGAFPLPVEIVMFGWERTAARLENMGVRPARRMAGDTTLVTDNGNYILDCSCGEITDPGQLAHDVKTLTGVVDVGLFVNLAEFAIVAGGSEVRVVERAS